ncbi:hypothetical protein [Curtobacterium aetherium]|uniref:Uncharacterized protein n=1 Tax=Curtobacterium aetherium TaxID=2841594 RepID=A0ACD1E7H5_9MICO|nr:hypothetical protein [Curtobacterium sp. L6-1]QWS34902.1 hypothetical protein KM842_07200 [Curtobacterium sp. L6-1]
MKSNMKKRDLPFRLALTLAVGSMTVGVPVAGSAGEAQAAPAPSQVSAAASDEITIDRWSYVWQRWDGTNYSSQATCLARGRTIMKHYRDVKAISCRKPCGRWWLYTYREQWV